MGFKVKCVPVLDRMPCCCCSCDLKVATCILGWLGLISHVGSFLRGAVCLAMFKDLKDLPPQDTKEGLIATVILAAIFILLTALLLYGAHNEKPQFMLPTVIVDMIVIVMSSVAVLVISILLFFGNVLAGFIFLLVGALFVVLSIFFWVVIYSYYRKLEEGQYPFPTTSLVNAESTKFLASVLGTLVGALILDALLLCGIHNKKPVYMLPFLVFHLIIIMVVMAVVFIGGFFVIVRSWELHVIPLIIIAVYVSFFWVVLYIYYQQMEEEKTPNSGIVNCMYQIPNERVQILEVDGKEPSYSPNILAPDMA